MTRTGDEERLRRQVPLGARPPESFRPPLSYPPTVKQTEAKFVCLESELGARTGPVGAEVVVDVDGDEPDEVVVYCPGCWQSEFGSGADT